MSREEEGALPSLLISLCCKLGVARGRGRRREGEGVRKEGEGREESEARQLWPL